MSKIGLLPTTGSFCQTTWVSVWPISDKTKGNRVFDAISDKAKGESLYVYAQTH